MAGDGDSYIARGALDGDGQDGEEDGGPSGIRSRPRRKAAVAAVAANRSKRWDEEIDFGDSDSAGEDEDDDGEEENDDVVMEDEEDDFDEEEDDGTYRGKGPAGRGRGRISGGGGPGRKGPGRPPKARPSVNGMIDPDSQAGGGGMIGEDPEGDPHSPSASGGVAPAAEGTEEMDLGEERMHRMRQGYPVQHYVQ